MLDWLVGKELQLSKLKYPDTHHTNHQYDEIKERADTLLRRVHILKEKYTKRSPAVIPERNVTDEEDDHRE